MANIEQELLQQLADKGSIADSGDFAAALKEDHLKVVGVIKSLEMAEMIAVSVRDGVLAAARVLSPPPLGGVGGCHPAMAAVACGLQVDCTQTPPKQCPSPAAASTPAMSAPPCPSLRPP